MYRMYIMLYAWCTSGHAAAPKSSPFSSMAGPSKMPEIVLRTLPLMQSHGRLASPKSLTKRFALHPVPNHLTSRCRRSPSEETAPQHGDGDGLCPSPCTSFSLGHAVPDQRNDANTAHDQQPEEVADDEPRHPAVGVPTPVAVREHDLPSRVGNA